MNDLFQQLADEIQRKEAEASRLQDELAELSTALRVLRRMRGTSPPPSEGSAGGNGQDDAADADTAEMESEEPVQADRGSLGIVFPVGPVEKDLHGRTILDAAVTILRDHEATGRPTLHYKEIAAEARRRGYEGRSAKAMVQSFWATLNRNPGKFKSMGQGRFALIERFEKTESD